MQLIVQFRNQFLGGADIPLIDGLEGLQIGLALEKTGPGDQLVHDRTGRENVRSAVQLLSLALLRRHVGVLALYPARYGGRYLAAGLGNAEVHQLHAALKGYDDVVGADVAVNHAARLPIQVSLAVSIVQAVEHAREDLDDVLDGDAALEFGAAADDGLEVHPVNVLHGDVERVGLVAQIVDLNDVGVVESRRQPGLVQEHLDEAILGSEVWQDLLDHHHLLEPFHSGLPGQKDLGHSAQREAALEDVATESLLCFRGVHLAPNSGVCPHPRLP